MQNNRYVPQFQVRSHVRSGVIGTGAGGTEPPQTPLRSGYHTPSTYPPPPPLRTWERT